MAFTHLTEDCEPDDYLMTK